MLHALCRDGGGTRSVVPTVLQTAHVQHVEAFGPCIRRQEKAGHTCEARGGKFAQQTRTEEIGDEVTPPARGYGGGACCC